VNSSQKARRISPRARFPETLVRKVGGEHRAEKSAVESRDMSTSVDQ
jgi:hypothetical protein